MKSTVKPYEGLAGQSYYAWQRRMGLMGGHLEARKFASSVESHDTVLDFGCGSGAMLRWLTCARRVGIDINPAARLEAAAGGVEVYARLAEVPPSSIDVVVSNHALEHVLSPYDVLCQLLRVLVPGGRLVICVPFDDWRTQRIYDPRDINHHLFTWTPPDRQLAVRGRLRGSVECDPYPRLAAQVGMARCSSPRPCVRLRLRDLGPSPSPAPGRCSRLKTGSRSCLTRSPLGTRNRSIASGLLRRDER